MRTMKLCSISSIQLVPLALLALSSANGGIFATNSPLQGARHFHTATLLLNGKILIAGGQGVATTNSELYDPASGKSTTSGTLTTARFDHTATLLLDGRVLVTGGQVD